MSHIKRMTPLRVVEDLEEAGLFYEAVGATRIVTDTPQCVGYKAANDTGIILTSFRHAAGMYGPFVAQKLANSGALYFHVDDIDAQIEALPAAPRLLARNNTEGGVEEAVLETSEGLIILAAVRAMADA